MVEPTVHRWKIPNFGALFAQAVFRDQQTSGRFGVTGVDGALFNLSIFPKGGWSEFRSAVRVALKVREMGGHAAIPLAFELWIEGADRRRRFHHSGTHTFERLSAWGWGDFAAQSELLELAERGP
ncbi:hypothetical protein M3Y99_00525700 [Aphelenchoides fujianensis]|nr:hypothetical protein M3Y99_00525700 [Aphelenchoides fujianensis]